MIACRFVIWASIRNVECVTIHDVRLGSFAEVQKTFFKKPRLPEVSESGLYLLHGFIQGRLAFGKTAFFGSSCSICDQ